jgi:circadian clock protein KaiA
LQSRLSIFLYISNHHIAQYFKNILSSKSYFIQLVDSSQELLDLVNSSQVQIDCLVIFRDPTVSPLFNQLYEQGTLLPVVIIEPDLDRDVLLDKVVTLACLYHSAELRQQVTTLDNMARSLDLAIAQFLRLGPSCSLTKSPVFLPEVLVPDKQLSFLLLQQRRLAEKLKERLGYLGVFYKRNPRYFLRNLSQTQQE